MARWDGSKRRGVRSALLAALIAVVAVESFLLIQQRAADRSAHAQSSRLLEKFLAADTAATAIGPDVSIRLQNVRFKWSDKVYIDTGNMSVKAVPDVGDVVDFDHLDAFHLVIQQSVVMLRPEVLEGMFNESVFNYPESRIRGLSVKLGIDDSGRRVVVLNGRVNMGVWIPFTMSTRLSVDTATNTLVITVDNVKAFKIVPATKFLRWTPFHLDRLVSIPPNRSLAVDGDRIMVKPFGLFPPPRVNGRMAAVEVDDKVVRLRFAGAPIPAPQSTAQNYVYLRGGIAQFGRFRMYDSDVLVLDRNPGNPFSFSLLHYADLIPRSQVEVHDTRSVRITMPDD